MSAAGCGASRRGAPRAGAAWKRTALIVRLWHRVQIDERHWLIFTKMVKSHKDDTFVCIGHRPAPLYFCRSRFDWNNAAGGSMKSMVGVFVFLLGFIVLAPLAHAQIGQGRVSGTVTDAQGGVMPGVTVTATSPALIGTQTTVTEANGWFLFPS